MLFGLFTLWSAVKKLRSGKSGSSWPVWIWLLRIFELVSVASWKALGSRGSSACDVSGK